MKQTTFIYLLRDPRGGHARYIGKADRPRRRLARHIRCASTETNPKAAWLRELASLGLRPTLEILEEVHLDDWADREAVWIATFPALLNRNPGGGGGVRRSRPTAPSWAPNSDAEWAALFRRCLDYRCRRWQRNLPRIAAAFRRGDLSLDAAVDKIWDVIAPGISRFVEVFVEAHAL